ncbi:hypothetical protein AB0D57_42875 [Streptomyces sp. NPDC048275]|uniref:hypothetical protein n=1 Tax=Streptomyces sp. NPDC048275 TaxID=3155629 RepID=UPI0033EA8303
MENEDIATFTAVFAFGAVGSFSVSRVACGLANGLGFEVFGQSGAAAFDMARPAEFSFADCSLPAATNGYRQVVTGPQRAHRVRVADGLPQRRPLGHRQNSIFVWQARAFLEQIADLNRLPRCPTLADGPHNLHVLDAIVASTTSDGKSASVQ